jgi:hypothetical protein
MLQQRRHHLVALLRAFGEHAYSVPIGVFRSQSGRCAETSRGSMANSVVAERQREGIGGAFPDNNSGTCCRCRTTGEKRCGKKSGSRHVTFGTKSKAGRLKCCLKRPVDRHE